MSHERRVRLCGSHVRLSRLIKDCATRLPAVQGIGPGVGFLLGACSDLEEYACDFGEQSHLEESLLTEHRESIRDALQNLSGFGPEVDKCVGAMNQQLDYTSRKHRRMGPELTDALAEERN